MRIFVTGTGRCGTVAFSKAAAHAINYTVGHESHAGRVNDWEYPDNHIEVDAHLTIALGLLKNKYPDALFVHLHRMDRVACVRSLSRLTEAINGFAFVFFEQRNPDPLEVAGAIYDTYNALCSKHCGFWLSLERAKEDWRQCWNFMACEGDIDASLAEWDIRYNAIKVIT